ncbi:PKD domain-containing protein, partial [Hymenobacter sp. BT770]|uniref:post-COAP-1 domain-containing protein n=1 Tax=Hymenobacter sp. BT770 TaxID=2886942 RepID=UPI001D11312B
WNVTDANGNAAEQVTQTVKVTDNIKPTITAPDAATAFTATTGCSASNVSLGTPVTADNCTVKSTVGERSDKLALTAAYPLGVTTVTWTVTDGSGNTATAMQTVTVRDNINPTITAPLAVTATANTACTATGVALGTPQTADNCTVATVTNDAPTAFALGVTTVTWTVTDGSGNKATATQVVTVTNTAPVIKPITGPSSPLSIAAATVSLSASFTDNNLKSATWDWDDNTAITQGDLTASPGAVTGTHKYATPGVYKVALTLTDFCGLSTTQTYEYVVVYDPNGGFVTGGGWINSPILDFPLMKVGGKATFGFVAKYKKGSTVQVDGDTEFQFQAGNVNFKSTSLTDMRLVISGDRASYKGVGTINGSGNYGFMVSAVDGDLKGRNPDTFRMKIWEVAGGKVVYDNQNGASEDDAATMVLGGGSIVIHSPDKGTASNVVAADVENVVGTVASNLLEIYPNPMAEQATIHFHTVKGGKAQVYLYNQLGELVTTVYNAEVESGREYYLPLSRENIADGVYFCRMITNGKVVNQRITIMR